MKNFHQIRLFIGTAALLAAVVSAPAQLTVTTEAQTGTLPFTPSWTPATDHLLLGAAPTVAVGDFAGYGVGSTVTSLTQPNPPLTVYGYGTAGQTNFNMAGRDTGHLLQYNLDTSAAPNGFDLTNITVYGGWQDNGRAGQQYAILYATVQNPTNFIYLTNALYDPNSGQVATATRVTFASATGGAFVKNVAALQFVFNFTGFSSAINWGAGYTALTVQGVATAAVAGPGVVQTLATETGSSPFTPDWIPETPNLLATAAPPLVSGDSTGGGFTSGDPAVLTDGALGDTGSQTTFLAGGPSGASSLIYTLPNGVNGTDVTNIVVYTGWQDTGRDGQYYTVSYATVAAPSTYVPITTVFYLPEASDAVGNRVAIAMSDGTALASGVAKLKFDFAPANAASFDNAWQGYSEIVVQGSDSTTPPPPPSPVLTQDTSPAYVETYAGDQVVLTATFSNEPPVSLQWQQVVSSPAATNNISAGVVTVTNNNTVTSTLTLSNVALTDAGNYRLLALNATNVIAAPSYSTATPVVVGAVPAPVNNVIQFNTAESGLGPVSEVNLSADFYPTWSADTNNDLVLNFLTDGSGTTGTATAGTGDFSGTSQANGDPTILVDGDLGYMTYGASANYALVGCGVAPAGAAMTYTLNTNAAPYGLDITNITVYGGWPNSGRNEQKYQVFYSTVSAPDNYLSLGIFDYNPNNPNGYQSVTRTTLIPATGPLARGVARLQIFWNIQGAPPKGGWEGYSEVVVKGAASPNAPVLTQDTTPRTAEDVAGSQIIVTAAFTGATSYQWQKDSVDIPGATNATLVLDDLKTSDTATNSGYRVVASNAAGSVVSSACAVKVDPAPAAVGNVITSFAYQTLTGTVGPTWSTNQLASSILNNALPTDSAGDFADPDTNPENYHTAGDIYVLTDGNYGIFAVGGPAPAFATCGPGQGAGQYLTYTLPDSTYGYSITNIQIAGGWNDSGRDAQWYTVRYSTVDDPATFHSLAVVTVNPVVPPATESVVRTTLTPQNGLLVANVAAIYVDFTQPAGVENGWAGYSEISVFGAPSTTPPAPTLPTLDPVATAGGSLILTGSGGTPNATYAWLEATNLTPPVVWTTNLTGTLDGTGAFSNAIPIDAQAPAKFFKLQVP